jgi:hypothetical protein
MWHWAIILVLCLCLLFGAYHTAQHTQHDYLYGYWIGEPGFCQSSDLDGCSLFIGNYISGQRESYLIMSPDVYSGGMRIKHCKTYTLTNTDPVTLNVTLETDEEIEIPTQLKLTYDMATGTLKLHDETTVWLSFLKDHEITAMYKK